MTQFKMFSLYLEERLKAKGASIPAVANELGYKTAVIVPRWFKGSSLPPASALFGLAKALNADPVVLSIGWLISQAPELEDVFQREVLAGRAEKLP